VLVTSKYEASVHTICLHRITQTCLTSGGQIVGLVKNNDLQAIEANGRSKVLDLYTNRINTVIIRSIDVEYITLDALRDKFRKSSFASSSATI
jgi:hypothetical protein